jgi:hypothetical protein
MLMMSRIHFTSKLGFFLAKKDSARLTIGDHPRVQALKDLDISPDPLFTIYFPEVRGILDDHVESWFLNYEQPPQERPEGMESVVGLGLSQEWLSPPKRSESEKEQVS